MKKKLVKIILLFMSVCLVLFSCSSGADDVKMKKGPTTETPETETTQEQDPTSSETEEELKISTDAKDISLNGTIKYSSYLPTGKNVTTASKWSSSNESILKSEGKGEFSAVGSGDVNITAKYQGRSATIKVHVYARPETIEGGDRYSSMIWGLENCAGSDKIESWQESFKIRNTTLYCNGDCDDAWLNILGEDITLVTYQDKLYLIANKDQTVSFTTFIRSYVEWQAGVGIDTARINLNSNSKLNVYIKDKDDKVLSSEELPIFPRENINDINLASRSIKVNKGDRIDFSTHVEGTKVTDNTCPATVEFSTINTDNTNRTKQTGYWLKADGTYMIGYRTIKIKD